MKRAVFVCCDGLGREGDSECAGGQVVAGRERAEQFSMDHLARLYVERYDLLVHHGPSHAAPRRRGLSRMMRGARAPR